MIAKRRRTGGKITSAIKRGWLGHTGTMYSWSAVPQELPGKLGHRCAMPQPPSAANREVILRPVRNRCFHAVWRLPAAIVVGLALMAPWVALRTADAQPALPAQQRRGSEQEAPEAVVRLRSDIRQTENGLQDLGARLPRAQQDLARLISDAEKFQVATGSSPSLPSRPPETKNFRPPKERTTHKQAIGITCQEGRIRYINYVAVAVECSKRLEAFRKKYGSKSAQESFAFDLPDSDYHIQGSFKQEPSGPCRPEIVAVLNAGSKGESLAEVRQPGSRIQRVLADSKPNLNYVQFSVWPDSFEDFRKVRDLAWEKDFETNWWPHNSGNSEVHLRFGNGTVQ